tara:strand:+ start:185 stop:418 length:234 start_codon:yes stop_codon:yes gene_type:complete
MTTKGNITNQIGRTLLSIDMLKQELRNKLTNAFGMEQKSFEDELTKSYIDNNDVLELISDLKNEVSKLDMLTKLISE